MTGFAKRVFHTHPICKLPQLITLDVYKLRAYKLYSLEHQHSVRTGESAKLLSYLNTMLSSFKVRKLDVCGRPLFANPVTYNHLCNKVCAATRFNFKAYVDSVTDDCQKVSWSCMNKIRAFRNPIPAVSHNDEVITSDSTKANLFNGYFISFFTEEDLSSLPDMPCYPANDSFTFDHLSVSPSEVFLALVLVKLVGLMVSAPASLRRC